MFGRQGATSFARHGPGLPQDLLLHRRLSRSVSFHGGILRRLNGNPLTYQAELDADIIIDVKSGGLAQLL